MRRTLMRYLTCLLPIALMACNGDTTVGGPDPDTVWALQEIDGTPFGARATLSFPEEGVVRGQAPCNTFNARLLETHPGFRVDQMAVTRILCPEIEQETAFFEALRRMTRADATANTLILSDEGDSLMVFAPAP
ncbi:META domain-containing protein [Jannaschia seohaensis]|uniref:Heat shock protein HslJ n=1 Tax=Jannaschia seohaensis TaxID=475081 RepID=A0A2Y9AGB8_9RHOB|nr:META domain-containing protein [Jannaschia seohaensis]PWJ20977.1 heat shock protein HslJ [Jannaschia seohaensis]SSA41387.1 heat shock protein HslJ [Jannaschia seohaensis]